MFGSSIFSDMRDDPFFSQHNSMMADMDRMMSDFHRSFGIPSIADRTQIPSIAHRPSGGNEVMPFGGGMMMGSMFGNNMDSMFSQIQQGNNGGGMQHSFSSTKVMSYSNDGTGQPKYYESSSSSTQGPNGVRQTRKSERNSETGMDRMAIGHHIYDRGHVVERSRNRRTKEREEKQDFLNIDEDEKEAFHREWKDKSRHSGRPIHGNRSHRMEPRAIESGAEYSPRHNVNRQRQHQTDRTDDRRYNERHNDRHVRSNSRRDET